MHRCGSGFLLALALAFVLALTGCLGNSSSNSGSGGVSSVTLTPGSYLSLDVGETQPFGATAKNAQGGTILGVDIQFIVTSGSPNVAAPLSVASNGNACAGTWDVNVAICSPGTPGIAYVQAVSNGISSPKTIVYVHQHIDSIQISNAQSQQPNYNCFSQGQTWQYQGTAYSNIGGQSVDITSTVGPMNWSFSNSGVVNVSTAVSGLQPNQVQTTARSPGITQLFATVSGTTSSPFPYATCLVSYIRLQIGGQSGAGNSITVDTGSGVSITATVVDTLGNIVDTPPLTWSTTNPEIAFFSSVTSSAVSNNATARANPGGTTLFASCAPPTCNIGLPHSAPVYASDGPMPNGGSTGYGAISVEVTLATNAKESTYTAWAATTGCQGAPGCSSALFSVTPGNTSVGSIISLPRTPNSMMFNHVAASRIYFGTNQGLMYVDVTSASPSATLISGSSTPCNVSLCGTVLTISNDGKQVVVSDPPAPPTPGQVYIYNSESTTTPIDLIFSDLTETATAAQFSPDQLKLFIFTNLGNMYVYSTVDALGVLKLVNPGAQALFSADGSFAYVADTAGDIAAYSTCSQSPNPTNPNPAASTKIGGLTATSIPWAIFTSPVIPPGSTSGITQTLVALEPPNVEFLTATNFTQVPIPNTYIFPPPPPQPPPPSQLWCNVPTLQSFTNGPSYFLGQNNTLLFADLVNNGSQLVVIEQNVPAVFLFNVSSGTTTTIPLSRPGFGSSYPLVVGTPQKGLSPAAASTDGSEVFVSACDQYAPDGVTCAVASIHIVITTNSTSFAQGDIAQIPYVNPNDNNNTNMCNDGGNPAPQCLPNLVVVRPE